MRRNFSMLLAALVLNGVVMHMASNQQRGAWVLVAPALAMSVTLLVILRRVSGLAAALDSLATLAGRVGKSGDYSARTSVQRTDEAGQLAQALNEMVGQIERRDQSRQAVERSLRESEERYALAAQGAKVGVWDWNIKTREMYFSPHWKQTLGYAEEEDVGGTQDDWFGRLHPADEQRVMAEIMGHWTGDPVEFSSEHRMRHKNGGYVWVLTRGVTVLDPVTRQPSRMAGSQIDITAGKVSDPLTELPNRVFLLDRLAIAADRSRKPKGYRFALLFLDVDHFKLVNDSLGHAAGDQLLTGVAMRLKASVKLALSSVVIARLSGDEFAILLEPVAQEDEATGVAAQVLDALASPFSLDGHHTFVSVSIGIAFSAPGEAVETLLRDADTAMYHAKARGRNCFAVFDATMRQRAVDRLKIESDLRQALSRREFLMLYQPRVCLATGRLAGFEALVRWMHPERGMVSPGEFIPIAEETGLIVGIGRWVLLEVCRQLAEWQREFPSMAGLPVSVNVSFRELTQPDFAEDVEQILQVTGLLPHSLRLEMTESSIMENAAATVATLERLKKIPVALEIDDFGTGYSSLGYLHRLPFDTLKVDRSFIRELESDSESGEIVATILKLAQALGMQSVAEGIETGQQLLRLQALGCEYGQGYYFARPFDSKLVRRLLSAAPGVEAPINLWPLQSALTATSYSEAFAESTAVVLNT